jgi:hypothetical protein
MACPARAQQPVVTSEMPVNSEILRLIAWAADFARRTHDTTTIAEMPPLLENWPVPVVTNGSESRPGERKATLAVLDALIQENT